MAAKVQLQQEQRPTSDVIALKSTLSTATNNIVSSEKSSSADWRAIGQRKREEREARLRPEVRSTRLTAAQTCTSSSLLTLREIEIISIDAVNLAIRVANRTYTSYEVTLAYCRAATIAQDKVNCLTEICFDEALCRAALLDQYIEETGTVLGPLHGVPISVKDHIDVSGTDSASGFVSWCYKRIASKDACIVECLREAGAVIYCKTSNPQSLLSIETDTNLFGVTLNAFNSNLSAGGSSGGEGALIAMQGSCLGVGTDIAGSVRIPALWNGIYGLRPSGGRLPHSGLQGPHEGMDAIMGVVGPLSRSRQGLELFCRAVLKAEPWKREAQVICKPWKDIDASRLNNPLTIAVMRDDGLCAVHPPILSALNNKVRKLKEAGHRILEWKPIRPAESQDILFTLLLQDQGKEYLEHLAASGEPPTVLIEWLISEKSPLKSLSTPSDLWVWVQRREKLRQDALEKFNSMSIDVILCPGAPTLAPRHNMSRHWGYTSMWNVLDWPAVTFPVAAVDVKETSSIVWPPHSPRSVIEEHVINEWDSVNEKDRYSNAPIGLQLIGRRLHEEELLSHLAIVDMVH